MISYDPHHWRSHLLDIRGSMVREIGSRVAICVAWSAIVVVWHATHVENPAEPANVFAWIAYRVPVAIPPHGHTLIGVALGLLLVFRTNTSYDRFWEGRRQWGNIVNDCRNLARLALSLLTQDPALLQQLLRWTAAYPWSVMGRLRGNKELGSAARELPTDAVLAAEQSQHVPLAVACRMTDLVNQANARGLISDIQQGLLDGCVTRLIDSLGACERIHNTPLPYAYMVHLRRALIVYLLTLPMGLVGEFGWATVPATLLIAYVLLGIEEIGVEIEDPFGHDDNDLPLKSLCETIDNNLRGLIAGDESTG